MDSLSVPPPPGMQPAGAAGMPAYPPAPADPAHAPGRPARDPAKRAESDAAYARSRELEAAMPDSAVDYRMRIFPARPDCNQKASINSLEDVTLSKWMELGLKDEGTLDAYLESEHGPGRYLIEPVDANNIRVQKLPPFIREVGDMTDYDDQTPARRSWRDRRRHSRSPVEDIDYDDNFGDDDGNFGAVTGGGDSRDMRRNIADMFSAQSLAKSQENRDAMRSHSDMVSMMLLMSEQRSEREERRREEERKDEERRISEERRRDEDRREERRREEERKDEERREREKREWGLRQQDMERQSKEQGRRLELMMGAFTAAIPLLGKLIEKKEDPVSAAILANMNKKPETDPVMLMLLKNMMEKSNSQDGLQMVIQGFAEASKMGQQVLADSFRSALDGNSEINKAVIKRALDLASMNPNVSDDDKDTFSKIIDAISGASDLVSNFIGRAGAPPAQQAMMVPRAVGPVMPHQIAQQAPPQHQARPQQSQQPQPQPPQQPAVTEHVDDVDPPPQGIEAVGGALMAIQRQQYGSQEEYQELARYAIEQMPSGLKQAVIAQDMDGAIRICMGPFMQNDELKDWLMEDGVVEWLQQFVPQLAPAIQARLAEEEPAPQPSDPTDMTPVGEIDDDDDDEDPV